jgi:hypothetical protein
MEFMKPDEKSEPILRRPEVKIAPYLAMLRSRQCTHKEHKAAIENIAADLVTNLVFMEFWKDEENRSTTEKS